MKLFLIPISNRRMLLYCQRLNQITTQTPSLVEKLSLKAAKTWHQWENGDKAWQKSLADAGNKLFSRIPFEEWGLKSVPPLSARRKQKENDGQKIKVIYPPSVVKPDAIPSILHMLGSRRSTLHRTRLYWSIIGMPIVAPFALVPIIPNIPFFYLLFRAWSHWRALNGGKHLQFLVKNDLIAPDPSPALDAIYQNRKGLAKLSMSGINIAGGEVTDGCREVMLISENDAKAMSEALQLSELNVEIERACRQVKSKLGNEASMEEFSHTSHTELGEKRLHEKR